MRHSFHILAGLIAVSFSCQSPLSPESEIFESLQDLNGLSGKTEYLASPFVAAGDRVYLIGHQNGTFPDLGWHVEGEMGGIWLHPIKLMDGFTASIESEGNSFCLDKASLFTNYPFANVHRFDNPESGINVERLQFVPDGKEGMTILFRIKNVDKSAKSFDFTFRGYTDLMPVWLGDRTEMIDHPDDISFDEMTKIFTGKDQGNDWFVVWGSSPEFQDRKSVV